MFGFNTGITGRLGAFCEFNALRKNQLLRFYEELAPLFRGEPSGTKCRQRDSSPQSIVWAAQLLRHCVPACAAQERTGRLYRD